MNELFSIHCPVNPVLITITADDGKEIVKIMRDGTVDIVEGKENEAAQVFWRAVTGLNPILLADHIKKLEAEIASLKSR